MLFLHVLLFNFFQGGQLTPFAPIIVSRNLSYNKLYHTTRTIEVMESEGYSLPTCSKQTQRVGRRRRRQQARPSRRRVC